MDQDNEVSKIFVISLRLIGRAGKETNGPYIEIRPAKLANHTARTTELREIMKRNQSYRAMNTFIWRFCVCN